MTGQRNVGDKGIKLEAPCKPRGHTSHRDITWGCLAQLSPNFHLNMSLVMRKPAFCICENKDADQLRGNRLCFRYTDSTIWNFKPHAIFCGCTAPGQKPRRLGFSQRGSYANEVCIVASQRRKLFIQYSLTNLCANFHYLSGVA